MSLYQHFARYVQAINAYLFVVIVPSTVLELEIGKRRPRLCTFALPLALTQMSASLIYFDEETELTLGSKSVNSQPLHSKTASVEAAFVSDFSSVCAAASGFLPFGSSKTADDSRCA